MISLNLKLPHILSAVTDFLEDGPTEHGYQAFVRKSIQQEVNNFSW